MRGRPSYELVNSWFSEEGVHIENSPTYQGWVIGKIREHRCRRDDSISRK